MEIENSEYFSSYADLKVHELMLRDKPRNQAYCNAILKNKTLFKGKTVMDLGAGTGILSIYCAQAGTRKVYAIEASSTFEIAKLIVKENNFEDVIEVINCKIEEFKLNDNKVDIIVSEWMGFYLLHEGMLDSVLYARDNFLKPNGLIFPHIAAIYGAPCQVKDVFNYWENVDGVSMKCFGEMLRIEKLTQPDIRIIDSVDLLTDPILINWLNLMEITQNDLDKFTIDYVATSIKDGNYQGFCIWFDCEFPNENSEPILLSTSPFAQETHWKQTVILLPEQTHAEIDQPIAFSLTFSRNENNSRRYDIKFEMKDCDELDHPLPCDCYKTKCILAKQLIKNYESNRTDLETNENFI